MTCFRLKIASSRSSLPQDATGEKMAAMQQHADYRQHEADARPVTAGWADAAHGVVRSPAICRRNSIQLIMTKIRI
ncbi:hypothetical protein [Rhizobium lusitanum]|uniref:hypothetical protein n=1 Tax=Rhizobium lusitanum TaxID=293958 RepID=UPI001FED4F2D|nr:hypothetical protein [Rhizobium lusitanum]